MDGKKFLKSGNVVYIFMPDGKGVIQTGNGRTIKCESMAYVPFYGVSYQLGKIQAAMQQSNPEEALRIYNDFVREFGRGFTSLQEDCVVFYRINDHGKYHFGASKQYVKPKQNGLEKLTQSGAVSAVTLPNRVKPGVDPALQELMTAAERRPTPALRRSIGKGR